MAFDLATYFEDPEGDPIEFSAYSNIRDDVVSIDENSVMTVYGRGTSKSVDTSSHKVTVIANDDKGAYVSAEFTVSTRYSNLLPVIDFVEIGGVSMGTAVFEADSASKVLLPLIDYTDDDVPKADLETDHFRAEVDPCLTKDHVLRGKDCVTQEGKVAIVVGSDGLNFEQADSHTFDLILRDIWRADYMSKPLSIRVAVLDSNDPPIRTPNKALPSQDIVVMGSGSLPVGEYFYDEDGDRLLVRATVDKPDVVTAKVSELDRVMFSGVSEGTAIITLTARDPDGEEANQHLVVRVGKNNPPVKDEEAFAARLPPDDTINEGTAHEFRLDGLFAEPDGGDSIQAITFSTSDESKLLLVFTDDGNTATIFGRNPGEAELTLTATDKAGNETSVSTLITINEGPVEVTPFEPQTLTRVAPLVLNLATTFTDADNGAGSLTFSAEILGESADLATVAVDGHRLTVTGIEGSDLGEVEIKITATDPHGATATSKFMVTIQNEIPIVDEAIEDQAIDRTQPISIDLSRTFADVDGIISDIAVAVAEDSVVEVGTIDLEDPHLTITALAVGEAMISLTATDNDGDSIPHNFKVIVHNVAPTIVVPLHDQSTTRVADLVMDIAPAFDDPDDDAPLTFSATTQNNQVATVDMEDGQLTIVGVNLGHTTITVKAEDIHGDTAKDEFTVEITNVAPSISMAVEDQVFDRLKPRNIDLSNTFGDADGELQTIRVNVSDRSILLANIDDDWMLTLQARAVGTTSVTLTAFDAEGAGVSDEFTATVQNIPPHVAVEVEAQKLTRIDDVTVDLTPVFDDPDAQNSHMLITAVVEDASVVTTSLWARTLQLAGLAVGTTSIILTAEDADGGTASTSFEVTVDNVEPVVQQPLADRSMDRRIPITVELADVFHDADGDIESIVASLEADGIVNLAPIANNLLTVTALAVGETTVTLTASDANNTSVQDDFKVTVVNVDPVVVAPLGNQTMTRVADKTVDIGSVFSDPDAHDEELTFTVQVADETVVAAMLSNASLLLRGLTVGETQVTLVATDADAGQVESTFVVSVENNAPTVARQLDPIVLAVGGQPVSRELGGLFADDGDPLTYVIELTDGGIVEASLAATNASFAPISRGTTTVTIHATDPHGGSVSVSTAAKVDDNELKAIASESLAGFGRSLIASTSSSIGSRLANDTRNTEITLDQWAPLDEGDKHNHTSIVDQSIMNWNIDEDQHRAMNTRDSLTTEASHGLSLMRQLIGDKFALNLGSQSNPSRWTVWGSMDYQSYEGGAYDGNSASAYLGADVTLGNSWLLGLAVANNTGTSDYGWGDANQSMDIDLTTVFQYLSFQPSERTSLWGLLGNGSGELDTSVVGTVNHVSDLESQIIMFGGSQHLALIGGSFDLTLTGDAATASLETESGTGAANGLLADVSRVRAGLEMSFSTQTTQNSSLMPFGEVSVRSDDGDGPTGTGIEAAAGIRMQTDIFLLEARGRTLAMHSADDYSESGFSLTATLNPSANATGFFMTIKPTWGTDAQSSGILWQDRTRLSQSREALVGFGNTEASAAIDAQLAYGLFVSNDRYLLTPYVDVRVSDNKYREWILGSDLRKNSRDKFNLDANLALSLVEMGIGENEHKLGFNVTMTF